MRPCFQPHVSVHTTQHRAPQVSEPGARLSYSPKSPPSSPLCGCRCFAALFGDAPSMGPSHCLSCSKALLLGGWVLLGASWSSWGSWGTMCTTCPRAHSPSPRAPQYGNRARRPVAQRSEHLGRNLVVISIQLRREARISATATWDSGCTAPSRPASLATAPWRRSISSGLAR